MKLKLYHSVVVLAFILIASYVHGQESYPGPENGGNKTRSHYYSSDDSDDEELIVQDSTSVSSEETITTKKNTGKQDGKKEGEDVLSFNFLYYIIQKFKMSDIVDQK